MDWIRALPWLALFGGLGLFGGGVPGCGDEPGVATGRVVKVVDGDTVHVRIDGEEETVRYIGVDTPETKKPGTGVQCFGPDASAANRRLVAGEDVRLAYDAERRDRYGRLLAYVYRSSDGVFVNAALVRSGYGRTLAIAPNTAHRARLERLERDARTGGRGLWGVCGG